MAKYRMVTDSTREKHVGVATIRSVILMLSPGNGRRRLLVSALGAEVTKFLERQRYERTPMSRGYRNG